MTAAPRRRSRSFLPPTSNDEVVRILFVGCDQRAERKLRCAGAEVCEQF
jgi:hypothetical protein